MIESTTFSRIAIYNRWWNTVGGGEKHAGAIAEVLSRSHRVELLAHEPIDLARLAAACELQLERVTVRYLPDSAVAVSRASADYDRFINASHLDYVVPRARGNALVVYFPATTVAAAGALGSYNQLKSQARRLFPPFLRSTIEVAMRRVLFASSAQSSDQTRLGRLAISGLQRLPRASGRTNQLADYQLLLAISEYSREWIHRYWQRDSFVLYPRIPTGSRGLAGKQRSILSVGRFFAGNHNKKHVELIRAFQLIKEQLPGWRLILAGGYRPSESNAAYLTSVRSACQGDAAITLEVNCSPTKLAALYGESQLYWHGTGFGEDADAHPDRFEHFGITVVEAMAAGCVPLVIGCGGLPEIVRHDVDGVIWTTLEGLTRQTIDLSQDSDRWKRLSAAAVLRAADFDQSAFDRHLAAAMRMLTESSVGR